MLLLLFSNRTTWHFLFHLDRLIAFVRRAAPKLKAMPCEAPGVGEGMAPQGWPSR